MKMEAAEGTYRTHINDLNEKESIMAAQIKDIREKDAASLAKANEHSQQLLAQEKVKEQHAIEVQITAHKLEMNHLMKMDEDQLVQHIKVEKE